LIEINGVMHVGIWSWLDDMSLRAALAVFASDQAPVIYLDFPNVAIPDRFRQYRGDPRLDCEPPPAQVVAAMYAHPKEPWKIRDRLLERMNWRPPGTSKQEWCRILATRIFTRAQATSGHECLEERAAQQAGEED
jgi:hypothetical protein